MHTYVIWDGRAIKVGKAQNIASRLNQLQTGNPERLVLLAELDGNVESEIQCQLKQYRVHAKGPGREWFDAYECANDLSRLLLEHGFRFSDSWHLYVDAAAANRKLGVLQGQRVLRTRKDRAGWYAHRRSAIDAETASRKAEDVACSALHYFLIQLLEMRDAYARMFIEQRVFRLLAFLRIVRRPVLDDRSDFGRFCEASAEHLRLSLGQEDPEAVRKVLSDIRLNFMTVGGAGALSTRTPE